MKVLNLNKKSWARLKRGQREFYPQDTENFPRSLTPGEWVTLQGDSEQVSYLAYVNPHVERGAPIQVVTTSPLDPSQIDEIGEEEVAQETLKRLLHRALERRSYFQDYEKGSRLVHSHSDELPGLTVDLYQNAILVEINRLGIYRFRAVITQVLQKEWDRPLYLLPPRSGSPQELIPQEETPQLPNVLKVQEGHLHFEIPASSLQKVGFYYDHRENRRHLKDFLARTTFPRGRGLDLYSYAGAWGNTLLQSGVKEVTFVDQGDFEDSLARTLGLNEFHQRGVFVRSKVIPFLNDKAQTQETFDIVVSDPPAFAKDKAKKANALQGYQNLHAKILKVMAPQGVMAICSCTQSVTLNELDQTVVHASHQVGRKLTLLNIGLQGYDHPVDSLSDSGLYLKYLLYLVD